MSPVKPITAATAAAAPATRPHRLEGLQTQRELELLSQRMRKRPLVLFFGRETFSDNTKYLYLRALAEPRGYEVTWCTPHAALAQQLQAQGLPCLLLTQTDQNAVLNTLLEAAVAVFTLNPLESVGHVPPLLGCLAGAVGGPLLITEPDMATQMGALLFAVIIIGGLGSLRGALLGALLVGEAQTLAVAVNGSMADSIAYLGWHAPAAWPASDGLIPSLLHLDLARAAPLLPYLLLVVVLALRPQGLTRRFSAKEAP